MGKDRNGKGQKSLASNYSLDENSKWASSGYYCDAAISTCSTILSCSEKDGLTANSAACQCGSTKCSAAGSYCDESISDRTTSTGIWVHASHSANDGRTSKTIKTQNRDDRGRNSLNACLFCQAGMRYNYDCKTNPQYCPASI